VDEASCLVLEFGHFRAPGHGSGAPCSFLASSAASGRDNAPHCPPAGQRAACHGSGDPCQCVIKSMNSEGESPLPPADRKSVETEGNCAAAMQGGEQLEVCVRSQIGLSRPVNSIRYLRWASLLATERSLPRKWRTTPDPGPVNVGACRRRYSWSENVREGSAMKVRDRRGRLTCVGVRAFVRAGKPGNAGGAKERRKVKA